MKTIQSLLVVFSLVTIAGTSLADRSWVESYTGTGTASNCFQAEGQAKHVAQEQANASYCQGGHSNNTSFSSGILSQTAESCTVSVTVRLDCSN